jgi:predicted hydrolase (HD superfamily)
LLGPEDVDEEDIEVIISHGYGITTDEVKPESNVAKSLFTVDELSGIILANAKMRPTGMDGMTVQSFKKKFKDKKFAPGCSREVIDKGIEMLGLEPAVVMQACIDGMTAHKNELGLKA